ncbi:hypothetical protein Cni_G28786 [Canna indica]|uniref:Uncharacterized protein n=1 Tax=Canna indica TaxID=4628 RepID=A0AAQ3L3M2_9LILI|nr:hypothetical protein Cni_G28786 [Canna indica]
MKNHEEIPVTIFISFLFNMAQPAASAVTPEDLGRADVDPYHEVITTAKQRLVKLGLCDNVLADATFLSRGYTNKMLASLLRPFQQAADDVQAQRLLDLGISHRFFSTISGATAESYLFLGWLKSAAGREVVQDMARQDRIARSGKDLLSPEDAAYSYMFEVQQQELSQTLKEITETAEKEILELQRLRRSRAERDLADAHRQFLVPTCW